MSSSTSAVTYTSVYTNSEPDRAFWGVDDEEVSEGGIPRVIVLETDIQEQDKKKVKNKQSRARNGKDKVKPKP
ncbi:hypothetical protein Tco_0305977, partial [Tanacetum coccineum]